MNEPKGYTTVPNFMALLMREDVRAAHPTPQVIAASGMHKSHFFEARKTDGLNLRVETLQRLCKAYGAELVVLIK